jgi:hypothetical protein
MCTHGRVKPSKLTFALEIVRRAVGPIDAPFASVESESVRIIKESRLNMINEWLDSLGKWNGELRTM